MHVTLPPALYADLDFARRCKAGFRFKLALKAVKVCVIAARRHFKGSAAHLDTSEDAMHIDIEHSLHLFVIYF